MPFRAEVISRHGSKLFPFWKMLNPSGGGTYHVCLSVAVKGHFTNGAAIGIILVSLAHEAYIDLREVCGLCILNERIQEAVDEVLLVFLLVETLEK